MEIEYIIIHFKELKYYTFQGLRLT